MMKTSPWENLAMTEGSDRRWLSDPETGVEGTNGKTYRTIPANPGPPRGRGVYHPEMFLDAIRASRRFGNQMGCRRL